MPPENSQPKRILMTTDTVGGVWSYSLELARALGEYGRDHIGDDGASAQ
jgi:hypothetical protein